MVNTLLWVSLAASKAAVHFTTRVHCMSLWEELAALDLSLYSLTSCPHANGMCCIV